MVPLPASKQGQTMGTGEGRRFQLRRGFGQEGTPAVELTAGPAKRFFRLVGSP